MGHQYNDNKNAAVGPYANREKTTGQAGATKNVRAQSDLILINLLDLSSTDCSRDLPQAESKG